MLYSVFTGNLHAYIDPAATSILLSSITAIVVAAGATFIVLWRKFKKGVAKTLHLDPNAGKEVEDDLVVHDDSAAEVAAAVDTQPEANGEESAATQAEEAKTDDATNAAVTTAAAKLVVAATEVEEDIVSGTQAHTEAVSESEPEKTE